VAPTCTTVQLSACVDAHSLSGPLSVSRCTTSPTAPISTIVDSADKNALMPKLAPVFKHGGTMLIRFSKPGMGCASK
jgi:hypothetical protein